MQAKVILLVAAGGACGAVARYVISEWITSDFPWGTLTVNILGSFLLGVLIAFGASSDHVTPEVLLFVGTGALGAFTTMSTFSIEVIELLDSQKYFPAVSYALSNFICCPLMAFVGWRFIPLLFNCQS